MPNKAERRKEIRQARLEEFERKKICLVEQVQLEKKAKLPPKSLSPAQELMKLDRTIEDREGHWTWGEARDWTDDFWNKALGPFIIGYTSKTWGEIWAEKWGSKGKRKHVSYPTSSICKEAQDRLIELKLDDFEQIFRFRMTGEERVYGFVPHPTFQLLWFDKKHKVFPTNVQDKGKTKRKRNRKG